MRVHPLDPLEPRALDDQRVRRPLVLRVDGELELLADGRRRQVAHGELAGAPVQVRNHGAVQVSTSDGPFMSAGTVVTKLFNAVSIPNGICFSPPSPRTRLSSTLAASHGDAPCTGNCVRSNARGRSGPSQDVQPVGGDPVAARQVVPGRGGAFRIHV